MKVWCCNKCNMSCCIRCAERTHRENVKTRKQEIGRNMKPASGFGGRGFGRGFFFNMKDDDKEEDEDEELYFKSVERNETGLYRIVGGGFHTREHKL